MRAWLGFFITGRFNASSKANLRRGFCDSSGLGEPMSSSSFASVASANASADDVELEGVGEARFELDEPSEDDDEDEETL